MQNKLIRQLNQRVMKSQILLIKAFALIVVVLTIFSALSQSALAAENLRIENKTLYERLGGIYAIAAVVDHFSNAVVENPIVGKNSKNPALMKWHTQNLGRLAGLKFMRTLWLSAAAGGPFRYVPTKPGKTNLGLEMAHRDLKISPEEFDEVAAELERTLNFVKVPEREKEEVLAAFSAHKKEVTTGFEQK